MGEMEKEAGDGTSRKMSGRQSSAAQTGNVRLPMARAVLFGLAAVPVESKRNETSRPK